MSSSRRTHSIPLKASFTSKRSTSPITHPALSRQRSIAPFGAARNRSGSCANCACATIRALRAQRLLIGAECEAVLIGAAETALLRDELAAEPHVPMAVRVHEAIDKIRVLEVVLAEWQARAKTAREVRRVRHRLHPTRYDK